MFWPISPPKFTVKSQKLKILEAKELQPLSRVQMRSPEEEI